MNNAVRSMLGAIERSPQFANNPNAREMLRCIKDNDSQRGEQIARNLCKTYGVSPEQAVKNARDYFNL